MGPVRAVAAALLLASPVLAAEERFAFSRSAMGTSVRIVMYASGSATGIADRAFAEIDRIEAVLSDYRPASDISRLGASSGGNPVRVSPITLAALRAAIAYAGETSGAFDPTIAPVGRLWRQARKTGRAPLESASRKAFSLVGYRELELGDGFARLARKGMALDLGGIGKGFACDRALAVLRESGVTSAIVSAGGDFAVGDPPPGDPGWWIGVSGGPTLTLSRCGISTSGPTEQFVQIGNRRFSHIIDPRTGQPVEGMGFVTVIAENATASDALATAISVLGPADGLALAARRPSTQARLRWRVDSRLRTLTTPGFDALVAPEPFSFTTEPDSHTLLLGDQPVWRTITAEPGASATGFKVFTHLFSPRTGAQVTAARANPYPHHRGLWVGWQKVTDATGSYNFWEVPNTAQRFAGFIAGRERSGMEEAVEAARIEWIAPDGHVVVNEIRELRARRSGPGRIRIDVNSELTAAGTSPVDLDGNAHHAGCQIRLSGDLKDLTWARPTGATSSGDDVWTGDWTAASFTVNGSPVTVLHTDDPGNPRPAEYSTRPYGRFGSRFKARLLPGIPRTLRWHLLIAEDPIRLPPSPSSGATILFDGSATSAWRHADGSPIRWTVSAGAMTVTGGDIFTTSPLQDARIHLEFNLPPSPPGAADQARANSGVYLQERYEIQILDSYGDPPRKNGCGAVYEQRPPDTNASRPAGEWQAFDIDFRQPKWNPDGTKSKNARVTVRLNGVLIHDDVEITAKTGHGKPEGPEPLPLKLQDHGHAVSFRNIRIEPLN